MKLTCKITLFILLVSFNLMARDHVIYSISQEIPMGYENEVIKKNYYINIGSDQGVKVGTTLDVFRIISNLNPYDDKRRVNHKVKVGEIYVVHSEDSASIGRLKVFNDGKNDAFFELEDFMIGDHITVSVN